jgi:hypothetical protein
MRRSVAASFLSVVASLAIASSALAFDCMNASKPDQTAGDQIILDANTGQILWLSQGVLERLEHGVLDDHEFHGLIGVDLTGDGVVDVSTWFGVGPDGTHIADPALLNGPACRGVTEIGLYFSECLGL